MPSECSDRGKYRPVRDGSSRRVASVARATETESFSEPVSYHTKIKDWPEGERPREKLLARGAQALTDAELLALIIRSGTGKHTALDIAKKILSSRANVARCIRQVGRRLDENQGYRKGEGRGVAGRF
jgi:hypothetical protein